MLPKELFWVLAAVNWVCAIFNFYVAVQGHPLSLVVALFNVALVGICVWTVKMTEEHEK